MLAPVGHYRSALFAAVAIVLMLALAAPADAASGTWERAWGKNVNGGGVFGICTVAASCLAGTSGGMGGEMQSPEGVATDSAGNVYVADFNNHRIQKFDASGNFLMTWGKNVNGGGVFEVCTTAASCLAGDNVGGTGGVMDFPTGVATDSAGNVYVVESSSPRVQKFSSSGAFLLAWGKGVNGGPGFEVCTVAAMCMGGSDGGLGGEMSSPSAVATDSGGKVYVADFLNNRIQKFDSSGAWERAWGGGVNGGPGFEVCTVATMCVAGGSGGAGGVMNGPLGVATDSGGKVYVGDFNNHRIQKFDSLGAWERAWGRGVNSGAGFEVCTSAAMCAIGTTGGLGGEMDNPYGIATDSGGKVYVADRDNNRIQRFDSLGAWERAWGKNVNGGAVFGICTVAASCLAGSPGALGGEMFLPIGIATDPGGSLYVADRNNNRVQRFADPVVSPPPPPPPNAIPSGTPGPTGLRAAALKKCKRKRGAARRKCRRKAKKLPV